MNWSASVVLVGGLGIVAAGAAVVSLPNLAILTAAIPPFDSAVTILPFSAVSGVVTFFVGVIVASFIGPACAGFTPSNATGNWGITSLPPNTWNHVHHPVNRHLLADRVALRRDRRDDTPSFGVQSVRNDRSC